MLNLTALLFPAMVPATLTGFFMVVETEKDSTMAKAVELGIAGLVVFLVTAPLMRWVLSRLDAQQKQNERLIESLTASVRVGQREGAVHAKAVESLLEEMRELRVQLDHLPHRIAEHLDERTRRATPERHNPKEPTR
jgi:flagellar biosynthesis/type III secretory pathway M-ring protein FliF/YscJ